MARRKLKLKILFDNVPPDSEHQAPPRVPRERFPKEESDATRAEIRKDLLRRKLRKEARQQILAEPTKRRRRKDEEEAEELRRSRG